MVELEDNPALILLASDTSDHAAKILETPSRQSLVDTIDIDQPSCSFHIVDKNLKNPDEVVLTSNICEDEIQKTEPLFTPKSYRSSILKMINVTRQKSLTPKKKLMYAKVINASNRLAKLRCRMNNYQQRLSAAKKLAETTAFEKLSEKVNYLTQTFIMSQIRTQKQCSRGRRFTEEEKILALTLWKGSGKGYRLLSKIFALPSKRTLMNLLNKIPLKPGINEVIFESLKRNVTKMNIKDKNCILIFDEMYLSTNLQYKRKYDLIEGVEDYGSSRYPQLADHINVFMANGIFRQWKQPICYTFSNGPTCSIKLKSLIKDVIKALQNAGLNVVATVCDQGGPNVAAVKSLVKESKEKYLRQQKDYKYFGFEVNNEEVVPLFDTPHLFKGLRNNLLTKNLHYEINNKKGVAKWDHIEQFYNIDVMEPIRICPKLTDEHVLRNKISKMKVKNCTQVFSHQVGSLMVRLVDWRAQVNMDAEAADTGRLILFLDELFDSLNSSQKTGPSSKPLKGGLMQNSSHKTFWETALNILNKMKFFDEKKKQFVSVPSLSNLKWTIQGFLYLEKKLLKNKNTYLLLRTFQQDALENFFGIIRSYSIRDNSPSVSNVVTTFKALLINNFLSSHSPYSNCEENVTEGALDNLRFFLSGEYVSGCTPLEPQLNLDLPSRISNFKRTPVGKCTVAYIAGYVAKKILKNLNCNDCKANLLYRENDSNLDFITARTYKNSEMTIPGTYMTYLVSESLAMLFYTIPRACHLNNIHGTLVRQLLTHVNFVPVNCKIHSDTGAKLCKFIVRFCLYFWCKKVNKIARGDDQKFITFIKSKPDSNLVDPIKLKAHNKFIGKRARKLKNNSKNNL